MTHVLSQDIIDKISTVVPNARCELGYDTPYELLIAVVLSAQCTDVRVNQVTKELFEVAKTPQEMVKIDIQDLQNILKPLGFFRAKAQAVLALSQTLIDKYGGIVPNCRQELQTLRGVGRKTANVVLMECFDQPTIAVDTHVFRVSRRLGFSVANTPDGVEEDLYRVLPQSTHAKAHQTILHFGRYFCKSQKPLCDNCIVREHCNYNNK